MAAVLACLVLAGEARARAADEGPLSLADYVSALDAIRVDLDGGRLEDAQAASGRLRGRAIAWGDEKLAPDAGVLGAVLASRNGAEGRRAADRLRRLAAALGEAPAPVAPTKARPDLLARLASPDDIRKGGDVPRLRLEPLTVPERVLNALRDLADEIASLVRRILDWLASLRPRQRDERPTPGRTAVVAIAFALGVVVVLAVLVYRARRRRATVPPETESTPVVSSRRDEDPLSREASGWEARAAELAAARRWREAIRAWYHAVLVALFQAGLLHHQRGRTNWEYVARIDPRLGWRPGFIALTSLFDREWYGRRASEAAALAECAHEARGILAEVRRTEGQA